MRVHWRRLEGLLGSQLVKIRKYDGDGLEQVIAEQGMIPNFRARFCTRILKIEPTIEYLKANAPCVQYVGLRADEETRQGIYGDIKGVTQSYPLREWKWSIDEVLSYLSAKGVSIPRRTDCGLCFFQRLGEWKSLADNHPDVYAQGERIEAEVGATFRSPQRDSWKTKLSDLAAEFKSGRHAPIQRDATQLSFIENCDMNQFCRVCSL